MGFLVHAVVAFIGLNFSVRSFSPSLALSFSLPHVFRHTRPSLSRKHARGTCKDNRIVFIFFHVRQVDRGKIKCCVACVDVGQIVSTVLLIHDKFSNIMPSLIGE